jgi:hypothetical protein
MHHRYQNICLLYKDISERKKLNTCANTTDLEEHTQVNRRRKNSVQVDIIIIFKNIHDHQNKSH